MTSVWKDYLKKLRLMEKSIKETAYYMELAADKAEEAADFAQVTAYHVRKALSGAKVRKGTIEADYSPNSEALEETIRR